MTETTGYMYTIKEMTRQMDMSVSALREARSAGLGPAWVRINGRALCPEIALHAWLDEGKVPA